MIDENSILLVEFRCIYFIVPIDVTIVRINTFYLILQKGNSVDS